MPSSTPECLAETIQSLMRRLPLLSLCFSDGLSISTKAEQTSSLAYCGWAATYCHDARLPDRGRNGIIVDKQSVDELPQLRSGRWILLDALQKCPSGEMKTGSHHHPGIADRTQPIAKIDFIK
jgi:hypothetical protein